MLKADAIPAGFPLHSISQSANAGPEPLAMYFLSSISTVILIPIQTNTNVKNKQKKHTLLLIIPKEIFSISKEMPQT